MILAAITLILGLAFGYWAGESVHHAAIRIRRFVSRWWSP